MNVSDAGVSLIQMKHISSHANEAYEADTCEGCDPKTQSFLDYGKIGYYNPSTVSIFPCKK